MKKLLIIGTLLFCVVPVFAQQIDGLIPVAPKLFTTRNAKLTPGLHVSVNYNANADPESTFKRFTGSLPLDYSFTPVNDTLQYLATGLTLDWGSPNSILGFTFGLEYNLNKFGIKNDFTGELSSFQVSSIRIPAYLKAKIGSIHNEINGIIMGGAIYSLPIVYRRNTFNDRITDLGEVNNGLYFSAILGLQYRFNGRNETTNELERTRFWIFFRGDLAASDLFTPTGKQAIFNTPDALFNEFKDLNLSIGIALFLGSSN